MAIPTINDYVRQRVTVSAVKEIADGVKELTLHSPLPIAPLPGQFIGMTIDDDRGEPGFRSYSLLTNKEGSLQICVKKVPGGRGSAFLHTLQAGDPIDVIAPLGYFGFPEKLSQHLLFIATGTGIVPILSLLENLPKDFAGSARLIFGVRHEQDIFYEDRIRKVSEANPAVSAIVTLSQPSQDWQGASGRVTGILEKEHIERDSQCFICGSSSMISSVKEVLKKKGVKAKNIYHEDFVD